jgi:ATP-dependent RNA helicase DDX18/HAS1
MHRLVLHYNAILLIACCWNAAEAFLNMAALYPSGACPIDELTLETSQKAKTGTRNTDLSASSLNELSSDNENLQSSSSHFFSRKSLYSFDTTLHGLCRNIGITRPSKIQAMAWPVLSKSDTASAVIIAEQTGSGKTLAYLLPLIQRLRSSKIPSSAREAKTVATPKLLILAPTSELADQIYDVCQKLSTSSATDNKLFRSLVLTATGGFGNTNIREQIRLLQRNNKLDVLISTPGRIATILRTRNSQRDVLDLRFLQAIVLDEVDVLLLDKTFGPQLQTIGEATSHSTLSTQFVFVTATLPDLIIAQVKDQFGSVEIIKGPGLHKVAPTVSETLIDVSVKPELQRNAAACFEVKAQALMSCLRKNRCQRTLVFCNTVTSCRQVENLLARSDRKNQIYSVLAYHNAMTAEARNENLEQFALAPQKDLSYILACTDRAARGVDFGSAAVDHVVLFDFPSDPADYVRRVGRTARAGRTGSTTVLAYGWQLPIARSVMGQNQNNTKKKKQKSLLSSYDDKAGSELDDGDDDDEYRGGVKGRRKRQMKICKDEQHEDFIGSSIQSGKLWRN